MTRRTRRGDPPVGDTVPSRGSDGEDGDDLGPLAELEPGQMIVCKRQEPHYARGYLGKIEVPSTGVHDLLSVIRQEWGGGRFLLQPMRREGGNLKFAMGSRVVDLAGDPIFDGRRYKNGKLEDPPLEPPTHVPTPVVVHQPAPVQSDSAGHLQAALLGLLGQQLQGGKSNAADTIGLVKALLGTVQTTNDPFGSIERAIELSERLAKTANRGRRDDDDDDDDDENFGMNKMFQAAMMKQFFGGNPGANPAPQMPPQPSMMVPPVPGAMWDPRIGAWVVVREANPVSPPPAASTVATPIVDTQTTESDTDNDTDEGDVEPITPDDVLAELEHLGPDQGKAFIAQIMEGLGVPAHMLAQLVGNETPTPKASGDGAA